MSDAFTFDHVRAASAAADRPVLGQEGSLSTELLLLSSNEGETGDISGPEALQNKGKSNVPSSGKKPSKKTAKNKAKTTSEKPTDMQMSVADFVEAVEGMTDRQLKATFLRSWGEHFELRKRTGRKTSAHSLHVELRTFRGFLRAMGKPCPSLAHTVDRINRKDFLYAPGGIRWADKHEQGRNRDTNIMITWRGRTCTMVEWSEVAGIPFETIKKRHQRGATDAQLFRNASVLKYRPTPEDWAEHRAIKPKLPDDVELRLAARPVPEWPADPEAWPLKVEARSFERGYQQMLSHVRKSKMARPMSRPEFCAWVYGSRYFKAGKEVISARHAHLYFPDRWEPEALAALRADAAADPAVLQWREDQAMYFCALQGYEAHLRRCLKPSASMEQQIATLLQSVERAALSRPCLSPAQAFKFFQPQS